jgi:deoxyribose-phosphate aldolase
MDTDALLPTSLSAGDLTYAQVAGTIDHSLLRPELTLAEVEAGCALAAAYEVVSVCVRPADVALATAALAGTSVAVGTVVGFPHGSNATATKVAEAELAMADGATELDMVINIGWMLSGEDVRVEQDVRAVVRAAGDAAIVKVILENAYLDDDQKVRACRLVEAAGGHYVKTSTGFAPSGATLADLRLMRASVSESVKVKAAGGVRSLDALLAVIEAGCSRAGATQTAAILDDYRARTAT